MIGFLVFWQLHSMGFWFFGCLVFGFLDVWLFGFLVVWRFGAFLEVWILVFWLIFDVVLLLDVRVAGRRSSKRYGHHPWAVYAAPGDLCGQEVAHVRLALRSDRSEQHRAQRNATTGEHSEHVPSARSADHRARASQREYGDELLLKSPRGQSCSVGC